MLSRATRAIGALAGLLGVAACSVFGGAAAPEPDYSVVLAEPPFELRDYGELVVARTPMTDGSRAAFGRLFDYISGENTGARDIAMTAPVLDTETADGAKIAMTAPVLQGRDGAREMVFVLPEDADAADRAGADRSARLAGDDPAAPGRGGALFRFPDPASVAEEARLRDWLARKGLRATGPAEIAGYNPPWTLPPYRRNEVLIPVERD